jgi:hypothetical protein
VEEEGGGDVASVVTTTTTTAAVEETAQVEPQQPQNPLDPVAVAEAARLDAEKKLAAEAAAAAAAAAAPPAPAVAGPEAAAPAVQKLTQTIRVANPTLKPQVVTYRAAPAAPNYVCPPLAATKNNGWPDPFHLICLEGEQKDWLGPRGKCSFLGTYHYSTGTAVTSQPAVLRGGGTLSGLTLQILGKGYAAYTLPAAAAGGDKADVLLLLDAVLTPFRDSSIARRYRPS